MHESTSDPTSYGTHLALDVWVDQWRNPESGGQRWRARYARRTPRPEVIQSGIHETRQAALDDLQGRIEQALGRVTPFLLHWGDVVGLAFYDPKRGWQYIVTDRRGALSNLVIVEEPASCGPTREDAERALRNAMADRIGHVDGAALVVGDADLQAYWYRQTWDAASRYAAAYCDADHARVQQVAQGCVTDYQAKVAAGMAPRQAHEEAVGVQVLMVIGRSRS